MIIDIVFALLMLLAIYKGYRRGLIVAIFSIIALLVGLAAAVKLSTLVAAYLDNSLNVSARWLPVISFILVFIAAVFIVRLGAAAIEKTIELAMLGWLNRIGGILLYAALYTIILSVLLFYLEKINLLTQEAVLASATHKYLQSLGPRAINAIGVVIPFFKNMFHDLERFFGHVVEKRN